jgi:hypothetical protein
MLTMNDFTFVFQLWILAAARQFQGLPSGCGIGPPATEWLNYLIDRPRLLSLLFEMKGQGNFTECDNTVLVVLSSQTVLEGWSSRDGGLSQLLAAHCKSECEEELDRIYAWLGILSDGAPASSLPIQYSVDNT